MGKKKNKNRQVIDLLKAVKAQNRAEEIVLHGKPICLLKIRESKKRYKRHKKHRKYEYE